MSDSPPKKLSRHWLFQIGIALIVLPFLGLVINNYLFFQKAMDAGGDKKASEAAIQAGVARGWAISSWTCPLMTIGIVLTIYVTITHLRRLERP